MRVLRLTRRFLASKNAHAPAGSPEARAVARVLVELGDEQRTVPGPDDREVTIPPVGTYLARPIASAGLLVCYAVAADGAVVLVAVKRAA